VEEGSKEVPWGTTKRGETMRGKWATTTIKIPINEIGDILNGRTY
jgi:hypothetical protein